LPKLFDLSSREAAVSLPFENVREQLLRAGIPPRFAGRYVIELREHLADLTERERKAGLDATAASERARELLGTDTQLTQAMIETAPRTLASRAPWAVFGVLPLVTLVAFICAIDVSMFRLLQPVHTAWPGGVPNTDVGIITAASFVTSYLLGPAIASACISVALRQRLSSLWVWIGLGVIALASNLFGFHMNVLPSLGGHPGGASFSVSPSVWIDGHVSAAATLSLVALRATILFTIAAFVFHYLRSRTVYQYL
jgi:hypothetical protein